MTKDGLDIKSLRARLNMSQPQFARHFGINLWTLRQWEQRRYAPDEAARTLLAVIAHSPEVVREAVLRSA